MTTSYAKLDAEAIRVGQRRLVRLDPVMKQVVGQVGPCRLKCTPGGYKVLVRSILSQQISTAAARTIRRRLEACLPGKRIVPGAIAALSDGQLQDAGVSAQKRAYIRDLTAKTLGGTLNFRRLGRATDEDAITELIQVKGVGRWTAQMFLLFSLGRPDIFAADDLGLQNAVRRLYTRDDAVPPWTTAELNAFSSRWAPWRSLASWYLWRSLEIEL